MNKSASPRDSREQTPPADPDTISTSLTPATPLAFDSTRVRPVLLIFDQAKLHEWFMIVQKETRVGREAGVEIEVADDTASRVHSRIVFENIDRPDEEPVCTLSDEHSRNGTVLNGKRITKPVSLRNGDRIFIGSTCLAFFLRTELEISTDHKLRKMATTDVLTGLLTRGYMAIHFQKEIERARRYKRPLTVMMIQLDGFPEIVEKSGVHAGNQILDQFAKLLTLKIRVHDSAARYAEDTFSVMLPETGREGAAVIAERLRKAVDSHAFETERGDCPVTISIGVAESTLQEHETLEALVKRSENALQEAQKRGRNNVYVTTY